MSDNNKRIARIIIHAPIETVWAELIETNRPRPFFFGAECRTTELSEGAPMRMTSPNGKYVSVAGSVTVFEPPYRYGHTFKFTNMDEPPCHVTYELREVPEGTEFSLITEGTVPGSKTEKSMAQGEQFITQNLKAFIETGKPTFGGGMILGIIKLMTPFSPKKCRVENWPMDMEIKMETV